MIVWDLGLLKEEIGDDGCQCLLRWNEEFVLFFMGGKRVTSECVRADLRLSPED